MEPDNERFREFAESMWELWRAYVEVGFTADQAFVLTTLAAKEIYSRS